MPDIFISYRREDTSGYAGRLYDQVSSHFGRDHVFMDVAGLEPGSDFVATIKKKVGTCDALIAHSSVKIGSRSRTSKIRFASRNRGISSVLRSPLPSNGVEVILVLVGGAKMPLSTGIAGIAAVLIPAPGTRTRRMFISPRRG